MHNSPSHAGIKCLTDAAMQPHQQRRSTRNAGLGIYFKDSPSSLQHGLLIQAASLAEDTLQPEKHIQNVSYYIDNLILANNLQKHRTNS